MFAIENLIGFFKGRDFSKALLMAVALTVPIVLGIQMDALQIGINITLGAILASPSDIYGSISLKVTGMLLSAVLGMIVTFAGSILQTATWMLFPLLWVMIFGISYLSIYGFRASVISFSGLFALVLSFSSLSHSGMSVYERVLLIGAGGIWYILLAILRHALFPKGPTEYYLSETFGLMGDYLSTRAKLIDKTNDRKSLQKELFDLQAKLTENHENLRELLIKNRKSFKKSTYQAKRLLIFVQLIDMLELAMANPVNYTKMDRIFKERPQQRKDFQDAILLMNKRLKYIAENLSKPHKILRDTAVSEAMQKVIGDIKRLEEEGQKTGSGDVVVLVNYWKYQNHQLDKIEKIERLLKNKYQMKAGAFDQEESRSFLTNQDYNLKVLVENFSRHSTIFRHSLRIATIGLIGYTIGWFFNVQNAYWILLTIIVIMRPNYGLTKTRFRQRTLGTLIGGAVAFAIIFFVHNTTVYAALGIVCFVIGFSMIQRNYKAAAAFITLHVLFIYSLLRPNVFEVIQFRVTDTLIGAGLSFVGNLLLWPAWEEKSIDKTMKGAIRANRYYLKEVARYYTEKGTPGQAYKLSRKNAFLAMSDLNSSFQRMAEEPKTRQKNMDRIYRFVLLNHTFLTALASLGTYIKHNPTTPASENFKAIVSQIEDNLKHLEYLLKDQPVNKMIKNHRGITTASTHNDLKHLGQSLDIDEFTYQAHIEEAYLVLEQLKWLSTLSKRMDKVLQKQG